MRENDGLHRYLSVLLTIVTMMICLTVTGSAPVLADQGTITGSVVNVRPDPSTDHDRIGCLYSGAQVEIISRSGEWYQVQFGTVSGWVHQSMLKVQGAAIEMTVTKSAVYLRSGPGTGYESVGEAHLGDRLTLLDVMGEWYKVKTTQGAVVYIRSDMVGTSGQTPAGSSTSPPATSNGDSIQGAKGSAKIPAIILDGQVVKFDVAPVVDSNRVLVPLRGVFEAMGATVAWNQSTLTATAVRGQTKVVLPMNSTSPTVNGKVWPLDVPAKVVNQRTLAPLRFVGEALGGTAAWNGDSFQVILTSPKDEQGAVVAVVITANTVNLRSQPEVKPDNLVGSAAYGERLTVVDERNGWYQVSRNGTKSWVAGWLVDVVREGEPSAAPVASPITDPEPSPVTPVTLAGLTISSERNDAGIRIVMDSGEKLKTDRDEFSGKVVYKFADRQIEGKASLQEDLGTSQLSVTGSNAGDAAIVTIQFPTGTKYQTSTENGGKREIMTIFNYISGVDRKTFGSGGEDISIDGIGAFKYTVNTAASKLDIELENCRLGQAQASYRYNSTLIKGVSFKEQTSGSQTNTFVSITTSKPAKFAVGTSNDDQTLNIMFVDRSLIESRTPLVVLDPGHGGRDPGASGDRLSEKDVNLDIVKRAGKILTAKGIKVVYTRQDDTYVGLDERTTMANLLDAALFVSVHQNANVSSTPAGTETYCYFPVSDPNLYLQKEERYNLALRLQDALVAKLGRADRGVKQGNLAVLRESEMPSALVEMVFISNPEEEKLLQKSTFLDLGAKAIAEAISGYMKSYGK